MHSGRFGHSSSDSREVGARFQNETNEVQNGDNSRPSKYSLDRRPAQSQVKSESSQIWEDRKGNGDQAHCSEDKGHYRQAQFWEDRSGKCSQTRSWEGRNEGSSQSQFWEVKKEESGYSQFWEDRKRCSSQSQFWEYRKDQSQFWEDKKGGNGQAPFWNNQNWDSSRPHYYDRNLRGGRMRGRNRKFLDKRKDRRPDIKIEKRDNFNPAEQQDGYERCPAHLKGKAKGLFYRDRARKRNAIQFIPKLVFSDQRADHIENLLSSLADEKNTCNTKDDVKPLRTHFQREYSDITTVSFNKKLDFSLERRSRPDRELTMARNEQLHNEMLNKMKKKGYNTMLEFRKTLPTYQHRTEILRTISRNQVTIISGDTGCGKSTQVGQLILEEACMSGTGAEVRILMTQPRRLAATSVAARIADERSEILGDSVGFAIRLESVPPRDYGSIEVVTAGVVLQRLQRDPALINVSHLLIDEAHERDTTCDLLLGIVKQILSKRNDLKVVLMSATMDSERFSHYFSSCPKIEIPGRMFHVEVFHLEDVLQMTGFTAFNEQKIHNVRSFKKRESMKVERDNEHRTKMLTYVTELRCTGKYNDSVLNTLLRVESEELSIELAIELVIHLSHTEEPGAILVFLPGLANISKMCQMIQSLESDLPPHVVYPLHSQLSSLDQNAIFKEPPKGVRKIIISTNIAETSITINDVVYVIDSGKMKVSNYDVENDVKTLLPEWISQANALQRQGRAGRVCPGKCYRLYTGFIFNTFSQRVAPEILRAPVHEPLLASLLLRLHPAPQFLASLLDPPVEAAVKTAVNLLTRMNILNEMEHLTPLGVHVARLPVSPGAARMLIYASLLSAMTPITSVASVVAFKDPFTLVIGEEMEMEKCKFKFSKGTHSDQLAAAEAQKQWEAIYKTGNRRASAAFCRENYLSERTLHMLLEMKTQFRQHLNDAHFIADASPDQEDADRHSDNIPLLKALIVAGLYPNVAFFRGIYKKPHTLRTEEDGRLKIHPGSVNAKNMPNVTHMVYRLKQLSTSLFIHDTSPAQALPLLFFGDQFRITDDENNPDKCTIWCGTFCWSTLHRKAKLVKSLREELHSLLQDRLEDPRPVHWNTKEGVVLSAIIELIAAEDDPNEASEDEEEQRLQERRRRRAKKRPISGGMYIHFDDDDEDMQTGSMDYVSDVVINN